MSRKIGRAEDKGPSRPSVVLQMAVSTSYESAQALAKSFGRPVFAPLWWPEDTGAVTYLLDRLPSKAGYRIESTRHDGASVGVVGHPDDSNGRLPDGPWHRSLELEALRGLVRPDGAHVHAVVHADQQIIHLIGYSSEAEVVRTAKSLNRVTAK